jgi:GDP/UDP-N,N'-diacetylbacillosamine 2-epimerase (hydrolysing)
MISKLKKICVVTGSRAEYGLLRYLMKEIQVSSEFELQIIATGMHLSPEFGLTYQEIEKDRFVINEKVEMLLASDTSSAISKSTGLGIIGFSDSYNSLKPDLIIVLGDRYEILAAVIAALFAKIPIAHIHGGETTQGAYDEAIRHSITKMAWWHFVAAKEYQKRVIQLGEDSERVFNVGGLGVDAIKKTKLLSKKELIKNTGIQFRKKNLLVTYHPVTLEKQTSQKHFQVLLDVLQELKNVYLIFTMPNADSDGRIIKKMINEFTDNNKERSISFTSMGRLKYLSTLQFVDGVIGNSSSGLAEAPTFKVGTINIGDRQKGRLKADSVIDCKPTKASIKQAIETLYSEDFRNILPAVQNPYGKGNASDKIMKILREVKIPEQLKKEFYDL